MFTVGASATVSPFIGLVEGTIMGAPLWGRPSAAATNGMQVTITGFEVDGGNV